jgi:hypothetical protein
MLMPLRNTLRQRLSAVLAVCAASAGCCLCGLVLTFVMAPRQALRSTSIARLPVMAPADVTAAAAGDTVLITGVLDGNAPLRSGSDLVAYTVAEWEVTVTGGEDGGESEPRGRWQSRQTETPALSLLVDGQAVALLPASGVRLSGPLHEEVVPGDSRLQADDAGQPVADGTLRYRGLADGDLTTVLGEKASAGGVTPEDLFAGDRAAFEVSQRQAASNFLIGGIASLVMAPIVLVGGLLAAVLGRRR